MKKIVTILCVICIAVFFSACQKEGVYIPSKKISKISYSTSATNGYLDEIGPSNFTQQWEWNSNGTLKEIKTDNGVTYKFIYIKKKRLTRVNIIQSLGQSYYEYIYDDKENLKEIRQYLNSSDNSELSQTYIFTHTNGKITEVDFERKLNDHVYENEMEIGMISPLQCVLPEEVVGFVEKEQKELAKKNAAKGVYTTKTHYKLTWSGGNVTKVESEVTEIENSHTTISLSYDNKHNPFKGFLLGEIYDLTLTNAGCFSNKNNVEKMEVNTDATGGSQTFTYEFTYTYKHGYPVTKTEKNGLYSETFEYK